MKRSLWLVLGITIIVCAVSAVAYPPKNSPRMAPQPIYDPANVAISGGAIDGTPIGGTTPAAGTFTEVTFDDLERHLVITAIGSTAHPTNTPDIEIIATYIGLGFDDDNDNAVMTFEVPGDWNGTSDLTFQFYYAFAVAPANGETVKFDISYRVRAATEDLDSGSATAGTVTETISSATGETAVGYVFSNSITIPYEDADNPVDGTSHLVGVSFDRDDAGDTENGEAIIILYELKYNGNKPNQS